jgi:transcriptional regulator with XRE-family HTH domain
VTLGQRIRAARESSGLTQSGLAHALGYSSRESVNRWEQDKQAPPLSVVPQLAAALDVSPCWLAFGMEKDR